MKKVTAYECNNCGELHHSKKYACKCIVCGLEMCGRCASQIASNYPQDSYNSKSITICESCWDKMSDKFVEVCLDNKTL